MNRKELFALLNAKHSQVNALLEAETPDIDAVNALLDEAEGIKAQIDALDRLDALEITDTVEPIAARVEVTADHEADAKSKHAFFAAMRGGFKNVGDDVVRAPKSSNGEDGGYTIPEDIQTKINRLREESYDLTKLVTVESVSAPTGSRVYLSRRTPARMGKFEEYGAIGQLEPPKFERVAYSVGNFGGFIPCPNTLLRDSDAALEALLVEWFGRYSLDTDNGEILDLLTSKDIVAIDGLDALRTVLNVSLGGAFKPFSKIVTNDEGLDWLDQLKDADGRPLLNPDPTDTANYRLRCGATLVAVEQVPSTIMPIGTHIPFIVGDLQTAVTKFDRQVLSVDSSDSATVGDYNAFASYSTIFRGVQRADYQVIDTAAWHYLGIPVGATDSGSDDSGSANG